MLGGLLRDLTKLFAVFDQEVAEEQWNFRRALAQRRHINGENVEAGIEGLTESAGFYGFLHGPVCGGGKAPGDIHQRAGARGGGVVVPQGVGERWPREGGDL